MQQLTMDQKKDSQKLGQQFGQALELKVGQGNVNHIESDLPQEEIDETDLEVTLRLRPVEIIFRTHTVVFITNFFKAKHLKSSTVNAAVEKLNF